MFKLWKTAVSCVQVRCRVFFSSHFLSVETPPFRAVESEFIWEDFLVDKTTGEIFLNEVNSMPGFTSISMFPKMCAQAGLDFASLVELLITQAMAKYQAKARIQTSRN